MGKFLGWVLGLAILFCYSAPVRGNESECADIIAPGAIPPGRWNSVLQMLMARNFLDQKRLEIQRDLLRPGQMSGSPSASYAEDTEISSGQFQYIQGSIAAYVPGAILNGLAHRWGRYIAEDYNAKAGSLAYTTLVYPKYQAFSQAERADLIIRERIFPGLPFFMELFQIVKEVGKEKQATWEEKWWNSIMAGVTRVESQLKGEKTAHKLLSERIAALNVDPLEKVCDLLPFTDYDCHIQFQVKPDNTFGRGKTKEVQYPVRLTLNELKGHTEKEPYLLLSTLGFDPFLHAIRPHLTAELTSNGHPVISALTIKPDTARKMLEDVALMKEVTRLLTAPETVTPGGSAASEQGGL